MSNPTSNTSGSGPTTDSSNSSSSEPSGDTTETKSGSGQSPPGEQEPGQKKEAKKKKRAENKDGASEDGEKKKYNPFNTQKVEIAERKARKAAEGHDHPKIIADLATLDTASAAFAQAPGQIAFATDQIGEAEKARTEADTALVAALLPVEWSLRVRAGGRKFVKDCQRSTGLATTLRLLAALATSGYVVPHGLLAELEAKRDDALAAKDAYGKAKERFAVAVAQYSTAKKHTRAAIAKLRGSIQWVKADARVANATTTRIAPEAKSGSSSSKKKAA